MPTADHLCPLINPLNYLRFVLGTSKEFTGPYGETSYESYTSVFLNYRPTDDKNHRIYSLSWLQCASKERSVPTLKVFQESKVPAKSKSKVPTKSRSITAPVE